jgi:cell division protein ZapA
MGEFSIKIKIANRVYPMTVDSSEEEGIRNAAEKINQFVVDFETIYSGKDKQDYLAMAALKLAARNFDLESKGILDNAGIEEDLLAVEQLFDQNL